MKKPFAVLAVGVTSIVASQAFAQGAPGSRYYHYGNQDRGCVYQGVS